MQFFQHLDAYSPNFYRISTRRDGIIVPVSVGSKKLRREEAWYSRKSPYNSAIIPVMIVILIPSISMCESLLSFLLILIATPILHPDSVYGSIEGFGCSELLLEIPCSCLQIYIVVNCTTINGLWCMPSIYEPIKLGEANCLICWVMISFSHFKVFQFEALHMFLYDCLAWPDGFMAFFRRLSLFCSFNKLLL